MKEIIRLERFGNSPKTIECKLGLLSAGKTIGVGGVANCGEFFNVLSHDGDVPFGICLTSLKETQQYGKFIRGDNGVSYKNLSRVVTYVKKKSVEGFLGPNSEITLAPNDQIYICGPDGNIQYGMIYLREDLNVMLSKSMEVDLRKCGFRV